MTYIITFRVTGSIGLDFGGWLGKKFWAAVHLRSRWRRRRAAHGQADDIGMAGCTGLFHLFFLFVGSLTAEPSGAGRTDLPPLAPVHPRRRHQPSRPGAQQGPVRFMPPPRHSSGPPLPISLLPSALPPWLPVRLSLTPCSLPCSSSADADLLATVQANTSSSSSGQSPAASNTQHG